MKVYTGCLVEGGELSRALSVLSRWEAGRGEGGPVPGAATLRKAAALFGAERVEEALGVLNGLLGITDGPKPQLVREPELAVPPLRK